MSARKPSAAPVFHPGDVVLDPGGSTPTTPGIVIEASARSVTVVWANGGRSGGPGLLRCLAHREPRLIVAVTPGMMGNRGWNREQAVKAALRLARIEVDDNGAERATPPAERRPAVPETELRQRVADLGSIAGWWRPR